MAKSTINRARFNSARGAATTTPSLSVSARDRWFADSCDASSSSQSESDKEVSTKRRPLSSPTTMENQSNKSQVAFDISNSVEITSHWCHDEISDRFCDVWYSKGEYAEIADEIRDTIALMRRGFPEKSGLFCYRGLEHKMPAIQRRRRANLNTAAKIVLGEDGEVAKNKQFSNNNSAGSDHRRIAERYAAFSRSCQDIAREVGKADAKSSIEILMSSSPERAFLHAAPQKPRRRWAAAC